MNSDEYEPSAMTAEATAILAATEYMLSCQSDHIEETHFHYDAMTVGHAAQGLQRIPKANHGLFKATRIMMSLVQRKFETVGGHHIHGHQGCPWNEFADGLATATRLGWQCPVIPELRYRLITDHPLAEWAWLEIRPDACIPSIANILKNECPQNETEYDDPTFQVHEKQMEPFKVQWAFVTANVGTMNYVDDQHETAVSQKAIELKRQFHDAGYDFIAIQEARSRYDQTIVDDQFLRFISAAKAGQGGLETWINRQNFRRKTGFDLQSADCTTWYHDHRCLAILMNAGGMELNIINIYAPQSGRTYEEIAQWWEQFHQIVKSKPNQAPMVILGDCNAKVGSIPTQGIGSVHEDFEDQAGQHVRELCENHSLLIPSTFQDVHQGSSITFHHPKGGNSRIDYIMVSSECADGICNAEVDDSTDLLNGIGGHRPLVLRMQMQFQDNSTSGFVRKNHYDRTKAIQHLKEHGMHADMHMEPIEWDVGVNTHWRTVKDDLVTKAARCFPRTKHKQRQEYFDHETWQIVCQRKEVRAQHRELERAWKYQVLRQCFKAWATKGSQSDDWTDLHIHQLQMQQAICYEQTIRLQQDFRSRKRQNWKKWVEEQWEEKVRLSHNITGADVFKVFQPKRMIHKHQGKLRRPLPGLQDQSECWQTSRRQIAGSWQAQFSAIENAEAVTYQSLCKRSQPKMGPRDLAFLKQTPTRYEIEDAVRGLRTQKAPGADGVGTELLKFNAAANLQQLYAIFLKTTIRGQTPVDMTGGWLIPLHKGKQPACQMSGYRAILLEATAARIFSRAWRKKIGYAADQVAAPMQMGGRPGQSIEMAHLHVRLSQSTSKAEGKSSAMLFVDLRSAFYTVVRQMLTGFSGKVQDLIPIFQG